jgi:hypothetical protein
MRNTDEAMAASGFLKNLRPNQIGKLVVNGQNAAVLVCSVNWDNPANQLISLPPATDLGLNPWQYNSSHPTNNPNSFDLWVDIIINGKTNRISNWSKDAQIVP